MSQSLLVSISTAWSPHTARVLPLSHLSPAQMFRRDASDVGNSEPKTAPPNGGSCGDRCGDCEAEIESKIELSSETRPSLFDHSSNSQTTLFSHTSKVSATAPEQSASDSEDISDISEEEDDFYDSDSDTGAVSAPFENSTRERSDSYFPSKSSKSPSLVRGFQPADSEPDSGANKLVKSVASSHKSTQLPQRSNIFFIANSPSPPESSEKSARGHLSSLFKRLKKPENTSSLSRPDDDSEWVSVSSEDEPPAEQHHSLNFHKRDLSHSHTGSLTDVMTPHRSTDTIPPPLLAKPRSLLSGLFLSELAAAPDRRTADPKPKLKRSSTTGIITIEGSGRDPSNATRPSILFSKKYNSLLNISRNYPHFHNVNVKNNILNDYSSDNEEDDSVLGKQKLIVGISDFNVTRSSNSINSNERKDGLATSPHDALSSSLTKYSGSVPEYSLKNLLSKSSLSLSGLFSSRAKARKNASLEQLKTTPVYQEEETYEPQPLLSSLKSPTSMKNFEHSPATASSTKSSPITLNSNSGASPRAAGTKMSPKLTRRSMLSTELSKSLKDSIIIDYRLGKVPLPPKVVRTEKVEVKDEYIENDYHSKGW